MERWSLGVLASLWPQEILRPALHGRGIRCPTEPQSGLVNLTLACAEGMPAGAVRTLWNAGCDGCPPPGWQPPEQLARELGAALSKLPHAPSPTARFMSYLRGACEGSRLVREALSEVETAWRCACIQDPFAEDVSGLREAGECQASVRETLHASEAGGLQVRRLMVEEAEALQGIPRGFTAITYRGKPAADGPRYRAIGNSMAVPVVRWILERIAAAG